MNTVLFTDDFYPNIGGIADVLLNLYKQFQEQDETLSVFNPYIKGKNLFNTLTIDNLNLKRFGYLIRKKEFYKYILLSFWSVLRDKKIPFLHKIKLLLYLFIKPKTLLFVINNIIKLYPVLKNIKFDLVISGNSGRILPFSFIISRIFKKKLISIAYGLDFLVNSSLSFKTYYFRNTDKIILITHKTKEIIRKMYYLDDDKLEVINVGIDITSLEVKETKSELRKEFNISNDDFIILSVGRHVPRKDFQLVLRALKKLNGLKIKYYLIGEGEETTNLKQLTKDLNLEKQVVFLGLCDIETRNKYYKMSDLFIMPSITKNNDIEGFGIVFLEANYFKVPVIGARTGGISEAIINRKTGFLIEQNDIDDLVERIIYFYVNETERKKMGEDGYNRVIKDFKWENIINFYTNLFLEMKDNREIL